MISDFIYLSYLDDNKNTKIFSLELPDIYNDDDDVMVCCGKVFVKLEESFYVVSILLEDNFVKLSEGEIYSRDALIESVVINLEMRTNKSFAFTEVTLQDKDGKYKKIF